MSKAKEIEFAKAELDGFNDAVIQNHGVGVRLSVQESLTALSLHMRLAELKCEALLEELESLRPSEIKTRLQDIAECLKR